MEKWKVTAVMEFFLNLEEKFLTFASRLRDIFISLEIPINKEDVFC